MLRPCILVGPAPRPTRSRVLSTSPGPQAPASGLWVRRRTRRARARTATTTATTASPKASTRSTAWPGRRGVDGPGVDGGPRPPLGVRGSAEPHGDGRGLPAGESATARDLWHARSSRAAICSTTRSCATTRRSSCGRSRTPSPCCTSPGTPSAPSMRISCTSSRSGRTRTRQPSGTRAPSVPTSPTGQGWRVRSPRRTTPTGWSSPSTHWVSASPRSSRSRTGR